MRWKKTLPLSLIMILIQPSESTSNLITPSSQPLQGVAYSIQKATIVATSVVTPPLKVRTSVKRVKQPLLHLQPGTDLLDKLAWCESRMGQASRNYFQMKPKSSEALGLGPDPSIHPYEVQKEAAAKIHISRWGRQFPQCSRKLGVVP